VDGSFQVVPLSIPPKHVYLGTLAPIDFTPDTHVMPKEVDISIDAVFTNVFVFSPYLPTVHILGKELVQHIANSSSCCEVSPSFHQS